MKVEMHVSSGYGKRGSIVDLDEEVALSLAAQKKASLIEVPKSRKKKES